MIKSLVFKFFSAFSPHTHLDRGEKGWTPEGDEQLAEQIKLKGYKQSKEYKEKITEWSKPAAIAARKKYWEDFPPLKPDPEYELLPVPDPLPEEMKGQSASTIQAMLRHRLRYD